MFIQDPSNEEWLKSHNVDNYYYVKARLGTGKLAASGTDASVKSAEVATGGSGGGVMRTNDSTRRILAEVEAANAKRAAAAAAAAATAETGSASITVAGGVEGSDTHVTAGGVKTSGQFAASFTSTSLRPETHNVAAAVTDAERKVARWAAARALGKKAYVQLVTNLGTLNLELAVDCAPATCDNFLQLARSGYYRGTKFHRLIRNFMIQGGDPTATGAGGASCWGKPFADEFHPKCTHSERGVLSMANSGPNSNGSQFFILFKSAPHLDKKHSVFGKVVGGLSVLRDMELTPTGAQDRPARDILVEDVRAVHLPRRH